METLFPLNHKAMNAIKEAFDRDGYYLAKGIYNATQIKALEQEFDRIVDQIRSAKQESVNARWAGKEMERLDGGDSVIYHTHNVQQFSGLWLRALLEPAFSEVVTAIMGENVVLHHTKLFQKPAEKGSPFPMHQDWNYFPSVKDTMIAGIIHVSEATDEMGCIRVYPGSHKLGRIQNTDGQNESELLAQYPIENATVIEAEAGDVVFFHYFTLHGSMPNRSQKVRKTVLAQLYAGDDRIEDGILHPDEHLVLNGWNHHATRNSAGHKK